MLIDRDSFPNQNTIFVYVTIWPFRVWKFSNNISLNQKRHYICSPEQNGYGLVP